MFVEVRLFAMLRERAGRESVTVEVAEGATVGQVVDAVAREHDLADLIARIPVVMAVNREYARADAPLVEGDELALIPPVSGGDFAGDEGYASFMELVGKHVPRPPNFITAMLDETMGPAALSLLGPGHMIPTLELKISFLHPVSPGRLVGDGRVVHMGKSVGFLEGSLADDEGNVVATATATATATAAARVVRLS